MRYKVGEFTIFDSFKITGRGLVIVGEIQDGTVSSGDFIQFKIDSKKIELKIRAVESVDYISKETSKIGLVFSYESQIQLKEYENLKIAQQLIEIYKN